MNKTKRLKGRWLENPPVLLFLVPDGSVDISKAPDRKTLLYAPLHFEWKRPISQCIIIYAGFALVNAALLPMDNGFLGSG